MAIQTRPTAFRFLDLAPELRNRVYTFAFADDVADIKAVDIFAVLQSLPSPALTRVSRQLHRETRSLHKEALDAFFSCHKLSIPYDGDNSDLDAYGWQVRCECVKLSGCPVQSIVFSVLNYGPNEYWELMVTEDEAKNPIWASKARYRGVELESEKDGTFLHRSLNKVLDRDTRGEGLDVGAYVLAIERELLGG